MSVRLLLTLAVLIVGAIGPATSLALAQDRPDGVPKGAERAKVVGYVDGDKFMVELDIERRKHRIGSGIC
jgi:hypothetical protein